MLKIEKIAVGMGQANCYLIYNETEALIIDPGAEGQRIKQRIDTLAVQPVAILLTHTHYDHIGALDQMRDQYQIPVYVAPEEQDWLQAPMKNLSGLTGMEITPRPAEELLPADELVKISDFEFKVVATPGHSPGGVSFIFAEDDFVVTGDALFAGSIGRTDLPGSDSEQLLVSIREQLFTLPENYTIYPGHGDSSTIGKERVTNPFFN